MPSFCNAFRSLIAIFRIYLYIGFSTKRLFHQQARTFITYVVISYSFFLKKVHAGILGLNSIKYIHAQ